MISVMILVGCRRTSCVCLKASVKLKPVRKLLRKINAAPTPNKCPFETKCWTNILALVINSRKNGKHFANGLFRRSGSSGDSHFEGGADQRLRTACLLGQTTNSHIALAAAPFLNRVHLENTEASVLARDVCSFAFNTFAPPFLRLEQRLKTLAPSHLTAHNMRKPRDM